MENDARLVKEGCRTRENFLLMRIDREILLCYYVRVDGCFSRVSL